MELVVLKCPYCGGELEFEGGMEFGFCMYCGTKVMISKPAPLQAINVISDSSKFFLLLYQKGQQTQHAIKDEVSVVVGYRNNAASGDPNPLGIKISTNGVQIDNKIRLPSSVGIGNIQISGIGSTLNITRDHKLKVNINGEEMTSTVSRLYYGDMVSIGNLILRVQPIPSE